MKVAAAMCLAAGALALAACSSGTSASGSSTSATSSSGAASSGDVSSSASRGGSQQMVALTFDDGPSANFTPKVLDILREKRVPATFFVVGANAQKYPDIIKREVSDGHQIGNHSYSHPDLTTLSDDAVFKELLGTQQIIEQQTGHGPEFVRYPHGEETPGADAAVRRLGLTGTVGWHWNVKDEGHDDWTCSGAAETLKFYQDATTDQAILDLHDANEVADCPGQLAWLGQYIDWAKSKGYAFGLLATADGPNPVNGNTWVKVVAPAQAERWAS